MCTELLPPGGYPIAVKYIISILISDIRSSVAQKFEVARHPCIGRTAMICPPKEQEGSVRGVELV